MAILEDFETFFMSIGIFIFERVVLCAQWPYIMREGIKMTFQKVSRSSKMIEGQYYRKIGGDE